MWRRRPSRRTRRRCSAGCVREGSPGSGDQLVSLRSWRPPDLSEVGEIGKQFGMFAGQVGTQRGGPVMPAGGLDLVLARTGLDELDEVLVFAHRFLGAFGHEAEDRVAQVVQPAPFG